jgi:hypothetical protein
MEFPKAFKQQRIFTLALTDQTYNVQTIMLVNMAIKQDLGQY